MNCYGSTELAKSFRTVRDNTIEAARDIPEDKYNFSPAPGTKTVEKMLTHIALGYRFQHDFHGVQNRSDFEGYDFPAHMAALAAEEAAPRTKDEVIALLESEGDVTAAFLAGLSDDFLAESVSLDAFSQPPKSRFEMILSVKEHEMHHRGQIMLIQRMLGIVPHLTRQREARMAEAKAEAEKS